MSEQNSSARRGPYEGLVFVARRRPTPADIRAMQAQASDRTTEGTN